MPFAILGLANAWAVQAVCTDQSVRLLVVVPGEEGKQS